jgi:hypothetical protein
VLNGTFDANDFAVTYARFVLDATTTHVVNMGSGTWTANGTGDVWDCNPSTGLTLNCETSTLVISNTTTTAKTFYGGALTYNNLTIGGDNITIFDDNNIVNVLACNTAGYATGLKITSSKTVYVSGFTTNGSAGNLAKIQSSVAGSKHNLSKASGTVSVDYMSIKDSAAAGGAAWYAGANSTNVSGNSGWIFSAPSTFKPKVIMIT